MQKNYLLLKGWKVRGVGGGGGGEGISMNHMDQISTGMSGY